MAYSFENTVYPDGTYELLVRDVMRSHPELLDDDLADFIDFSGEVEEVDLEFTVHYWSMGDSRSYRTVKAGNKQQAVDIVKNDPSAMFAQLYRVEVKIVR